MALNTSTSIVDYLKDQGQDSSFATRSNIAKTFGVTDYTGTATQNVDLLNRLQQSQVAPTAQATPTLPTTSIAPTTPVQSINQAVQPTQPVSNVPLSDTLSNAQSFAREQADILRSGLADLYTGQAGVVDTQKASATARRDELLATLEAGKEPIESDYQAGVRQAYIDRVLGGNVLSEELSRLGLDASGFGVGQKVDLQTTLGQTRAGLRKTRSERLQDLSNQGIDVEKDFGIEIADLESAFSQNTAELDRYISEREENVFNTSLTNYLEDIQRQDALKQQDIENRADATTGTAEGDIGFTDTENFDNTGKYTGPATSTNPYGVSNTQTRSDAELGTFSNGYQPKYYNGVKLTSSNQKVGEKFGTGVNFGATGINLDNQTIWKAGDKFVVWDGTQDKYMDITNDM